MANNSEIEGFTKRIKRKPLRRRHSSSNESEEDESDVGVSSKLEEMKILQKLRERPNGVTLVGLALGKKVTNNTEDECVTDPFKVKCGGMINMSALKSGKIKKVDDAYDTGIGTQFSAETNKRDEDEEMMKYIENQLTQRKLKVKEVKSETSLESEQYCSPEEAALQAVPEHLRMSSTQRSEEMLSNQMLSGIPEVDLGIDAKIRNIEATEEAKLKLLWNRHNKNEGPSQFVPTNMAVNFVQHNRFNMEENELSKKGSTVAAKSKLHQVPNVVNIHEEKPSLKRKEGEKATDDYHYEKFKKQFRRY